MRTTVTRGRVYRRCGCRDTQHRQLGTRCPTLHTDPGHGTWTFAVDLPNPDRRTTIRRGGYPTEEAARTGLGRLLEGSAAGFNADPNQTLADYLTAYVHTQLARGRGRVTIHRILATLSSALGDAVRHQRLPRNPARPTLIPRPPAKERHIWPPEQAAQFLRHCHEADPQFAALIEVLIGTGLRKGEALGLHWNDIHLDQRVLYVRWTLSAVNNTHLVLNAPKTRTSRNWVAISDRVATALENRANQHTPTAAEEPDDGFVFALPDGRPLHPSYVLRHFHTLCDHAGVPRCAVHDLRHLAATISITHGVPLTIVSKTLRHSTLSTTANTYAHLTAQAARDAVDTIDNTLTQADQPAVRTQNRDIGESPNRAKPPVRRIADCHGPAPRRSESITPYIGARPRRVQASPGDVSDGLSR